MHLGHERDSYCTHLPTLVNSLPLTFGYR